MNHLALNKNWNSEYGQVACKQIDITKVMRIRQMSVPKNPHIHGF